MKRVSGIILCYILVFFIPWMTTFLSVDAQVGLECAEVTYLEVGMEGVVSCSFEDFYAVTWYTKEEYDTTKHTLIHFNGEKHGQTAEYDVYPNGAFIIRNVTFNHSGRYVVTLLRDVTSKLIVQEVRVEVYVIPNPPYPVVEGRILQQHVYMDVNRDGEISCSMRGVYPNVSLTWTVLDPSQSNKIQFQHDVIGKMQNEDKTYDITLSSMFQVTDPSLRRITIQCGVANEIGEYFSAKTKVDLLFSAAPTVSPGPSMPVIDGCYSKQDSCLLKVQRTGELTCAVKNSLEVVDLQWKILDVVDLQQVFAFKKQRYVSSNESGTFDVSITTPFSVKNNSLDSLTVECGAFTARNGMHTASSRVHLLFEGVAVLPAAPAEVVVDGCYSQQDLCTLEVDNKGTLTCSVKDSPYLVDLKWKSILEEPSSMLFHDEKSTVTTYFGDTFDQSTIVSYNITDSSLKQARVECEAYEHDSHILYSKSSVLLIFKNADDPHINQNSTKLDIVFVVNITVLLVVFLWLLVMILEKLKKQRILHQMKKVRNCCSKRSDTSQGEGPNVPNQGSEQVQILLHRPENGATSTNKGLIQIILGVFQKMLEKLVSSESDIEALIGNEVRSEYGEGSNREIKDETKM